VPKGAPFKCNFKGHKKERKNKSMIVPAILYKEEILKELSDHKYTDDEFYYSGWIGNDLPEITLNSDGSNYQFAIVDNGKLIGYFSYYMDWYTSCASRFRLFSFDRKNPKIGFDVYRELQSLIGEHHIHRLEWRMIGGNPVEKHYDNFCKKYNGKKFVLTDVIKDKYGKYHNEIIYEIIAGQQLDS